MCPNDIVTVESTVSLADHIDSVITCVCTADLL